MSTVLGKAAAEARGIADLHSLLRPALEPHNTQPLRNYTIRPRS